MNKQSSSSQFKLIDAMDDMTSHSVIDWIADNKRAILFGFLALLAVIVIAFRFAAANTLTSQSDFYQAQNDFSRLQTESIGATEETDNLVKLEALLAKHPELQTKYDAPLAQALIISQKPTAAQPFAEKTFQRVQNDSLAFYENYAKNSLLISEGQYDKALAQALQLKENLNKDMAKNFGGTLALYNLIRIASLHQQLKNSKEELLAWNEVEQYKGGFESLLAIQQLFKIDNATLSSYIENRKKELN